MKLKHFAPVCLCFVLAGCSTAAGVSKENIFYSEQNPNIRIQIDPSLITQDPFSYEVNQKGGDFAETIINTIYPFAETEGKDLKRAFTIVFRDMTRPTQFWRDAGDGAEKSFSGVSFRIYPIGNFVENGLSKEVTLRGLRMTGRFSGILFNRVVNRQRLMILAYIEKTPMEFDGMYWDQNRLSEKQEEYLRQLEQRATEAFTITSYSIF